MTVSHVHQTDDAALSAASKPSGEGAAEGYLTEADPPSYSYDDLLDRAVELLHQHNPEYSEKRRYNLKPPQLMKSKCLCAHCCEIDLLDYVPFVCQSAQRRLCG